MKKVLVFALFAIIFSTTSCTEKKETVIKTPEEIISDKADSIEAINNVDTLMIDENSDIVEEGIEIDCK